MSVNSCDTHTDLESDIIELVIVSQIIAGCAPPRQVLVCVCVLAVNVLCVMIRVSCKRREFLKVCNTIRCSRGNVKNDCVRRYLTTTSEFCDNCMGSRIARDFALLRAGLRYTVARSFNVGIELSMMEIEKQIAEVSEIIQAFVNTVEIYLLFLMTVCLCVFEDGLVMVSRKKQQGHTHM